MCNRMNNQLDFLKKLISTIDRANVKNIKIYKTDSITPLFDYVVIATATSTRQMNAVAQHIKDDSKEKGYEIRGVEGLNGGVWVLVDLHDVLVNIFSQEERDNFALDKMWKDLPQIAYEDLITKRQVK